MIFLVDKKNRPLNMLHPAQGRKFLDSGKASVISNYPFVLKLKHEIQEPLLNEYVIKIDPGAKTTGISILQGNKIMFCAELEHNAFLIIKKLQRRAMLRRGRRGRKTRYRKPRFLNRRNKKAGWIPPSLKARIDNIVNWCKKLIKICPITSIVIEHCKFDTQLMDKPEIKGVEYQQGTLMGYEIREYLLEKYSHRCVYCSDPKKPHEMTKGRLEIEHIEPKARGGSDKITNLTLACRKCNQKKGSLSIQEFGKKVNKDFSYVLENAGLSITQYKKKTNKKADKSTAIMNSSRWKTFEELSNIAPVTCGTGGMTKLKRTINKLPKTHYFDAACVGHETPENLQVKTEKVLCIKASGRGSYKRTNTDKYGFRRKKQDGTFEKISRQKNFFGFYLKSTVSGIKDGKTFKGTITSCRSSGGFTVKSFSGEQIPVNYKNLKLIQGSNGYEYSLKDIE